jgi:hypothetical protein
MAVIGKSKAVLALLWLMATAGAALFATPAAAAGAAAAAGEQHFASPEAAVQELIAANRSDDPAALLRILGPRGAKLLHSGDEVADRDARAHFLSAYDVAHRIEPEGLSKALLLVGHEEWPLPIPLVRDEHGWRFDTHAGEEEILNRRIGRNELSAIRVCRAYVQAQREFARLKSSARGEREYAQRFVSQPGKHDGLYWPTGNSQESESPLGPLVAEARAEGYVAGSNGASHHPYFGYYYRILTRQGHHAPGGAGSYIGADGRMTGGFALLAYPASYGDSGIMTFIVNQHGIVFERNLGRETAEHARAITEYDPDGSWRPVADMPAKAR